MGKGAPGLFDFGTGIYTRRQAEEENAKRLREAQGPLYDKAMGGAQTSLNMAGGFDPKAHAAERFNAGQGLLAGKDAADEASLMRSLYAKGMLGAGKYNPGVEGITPNGAVMNPQLAAFYAARNARNAKMAQDSLGQGEEYLNNLMKRSGMLQDQAIRKQAGGLTAQNTQPSRATGTAEMLKGVSGILKDTGLFNTGVDWLKKILGGGSPGYGGDIFGGDWYAGDWGANDYSDFDWIG